MIGAIAFLYNITKCSQNTIHDHTQEFWAVCLWTQDAAEFFEGPFCFVFK